MNFTCDNCQKRYSIADEKVRGKTVKVRCKNCQNVITVEGPAEEESTRVVSLADVERIRAQERSLAGGGAAAPAAPAPVSAVAAPAPLAKPPASAPQTPWDDEPTRTAPPRQTAGAPWFVMVRNKQEGPLDESAVAEWMAAGTISARSFFWRQGMPDWKRGSDIPELAALLTPAAPPEPPPPPPPPEPVAPPPARAAAPARREPEPQQPFYAENEPAPSQDDFERDGDEDEGTLFGNREAPAPVPTPAPRRAVSAPREDAPAASGAPLNELFSDLDLPGNRGEASDEEDLGQDETREDPRNDEDEEDAAPPVDSKAARKRPVVPAKRGSPLKVVALVVLLLIVLPVVALFGLSAAGMLPPALADMVNKVTGKAPPPAPRQAAPAPGAAEPVAPSHGGETAAPAQGAAPGGEAAAPSAEGSKP
ncbi:GYF domain-containing protein [Corallococcus sp. EGB]|uniref:GYF domain-containing protein n=1 Tax=Corallococcus sp. EGB TaxID=1521117 RepID=UPI001CBC5460|nr:GYF domain-containing protein [Corallococcus sp. EGB]